MSGLRLVLVRHGETNSNVDKSLDSAPPGPPLNETGRRQAAELVEALATEPIVAILASTATRAQQTAAPLAEKLGMPVQVVDGAQEVFVGSLEKRRDDEAQQQFVSVVRAWSDGDLDARMPSGESGREATRRFTAVVEELRATYDSGVVVLFAHGAVIRLVAAALADNVPHEVVGRGFVPNGGRVILEPDGTGWHCTEWPGEYFVR